MEERPSEEFSLTTFIPSPSPKSVAWLDPCSGHKSLLLVHVKLDLLSGMREVVYMGQSQSACYSPVCARLLRLSSLAVKSSSCSPSDTRLRQSIIDPSMTELGSPNSVDH